MRLDDLNKPINPDKGKLNGSCNRRACQKPGADWFNKSTRAHYCRSCARRINRANGEICKKVEPKPAPHFHPPKTSFYDLF